MSSSLSINVDAQTAPVGSCGGAGSSVPTNGPLEFDAVVGVDLSRTYDLISDSPQTINIPGPSSSYPNAPQANVLIIQVTGPKIVATITTADGNAQTIPVDPLLVLVSQTTSPITALTLTRTAGNETFASVYLGQI